MPATFDIEAPDIDDRATPPPEIPVQTLITLLKELGYGYGDRREIVLHAMRFNTLELCPLFISEYHREWAERVLPFDPEFERYETEVWQMTPFAESLTPWGPHDRPYRSPVVEAAR